VLQDSQWVKISRLESFLRNPQKRHTDKQNPRPYCQTWLSNPPTELEHLPPNITACKFLSLFLDMPTRYFQAHQSCTTVFKKCVKSFPLLSKQYLQGAAFFKAIEQRLLVLDWNRPDAKSRRPDVAHVVLEQELEQEGPHSCQKDRIVSP